MPIEIIYPRFKSGVFCGIGEKMVEIIKMTENELADCTEIWNSVVEDGNSFPQLEVLDLAAARDFFGSQSYTGAAIITEGNEVAGVYILHPNNVGRCGHICNASYAVKKNRRGMHIGEAMVRDCIKKGKELGFKILQFNAVVKSNNAALALYKKLGFKQLGIIPDGFMLKTGEYEDIIPHYIEL